MSGQHWLKLFIFYVIFFCNIWSEGSHSRPEWVDVSRLDWCDPDDHDDPDERDGPDGPDGPDGSDGSDGIDDHDYPEHPDDHDAHDNHNESYLVKKFYLVKKPILS